MDFICKIRLCGVISFCFLLNFDTWTFAEFLNGHRARNCKSCTKSVYCDNTNVGIVEKCNCDFPFHRLVQVFKKKILDENHVDDETDALNTRAKRRVSKALSVTSTGSN